MQSSDLLNDDHCAFFQRKKEKLKKKFGKNKEGSKKECNQARQPVQSLGQVNSVCVCVCVIERERKKLRVCDTLFFNCVRIFERKERKKEALTEKRFRAK